MAGELDQRPIDNPVWKMVHNIHVSEGASAELARIEKRIRKRVEVEMLSQPSMGQYPVDYHVQRRMETDPEAMVQIARDVLARDRARMYGLAAQVQETKRLRVLLEQLLRRLPDDDDDPTPPQMRPQAV